MNIDIVITGGIGLITSVVSSVTTWLLARRKYNTEVDNNLIDNMKESLDFYKSLCADNKIRLEEVLNRNAELDQELRDLRKQVFNLMSSICTDLTCQLRKRSLNIFNEHGINTGKKMEED